MAGYTEDAMATLVRVKAGSQMVPTAGNTPDSVSWVSLKSCDQTIPVHRWRNRGRVVGDVGKLFIHSYTGETAG